MIGIRVTVTAPGRDIHKHPSYFLGRYLAVAGRKAVSLTPVETGVAARSWIISPHEIVEYVAQPRWPKTDQFRGRTSPPPERHVWNVLRGQNLGEAVSMDGRGGWGTTSDTDTTRFASVGYLTNSVPYIDQLELGSSNQAPNGMLAQTVEYLRLRRPYHWRAWIGYTEPGWWAGRWQPRPLMSTGIYQYTIQDVSTSLLNTPIAPAVAEEDNWV